MVVLISEEAAYARKQGRRTSSGGEDAVRRGADPTQGAPGPTPGPARERSAGGGDGHQKPDRPPLGEAGPLIARRGDGSGVWRSATAMVDLRRPSSHLAAHRRGNRTR